MQQPFRIGNCAGFSGDRVGAPGPALETGGGDIVSANAYLSARPIVEALAAGAQVVVTGRTGDPSLALAPLIHHYGWGYNDWARLSDAESEDLVAFLRTLTSRSFPDLNPMTAPCKRREQR